MDTHPCAQVLLGLTLTPQLLCRPVSSRLTSVDFGTNFSFSVDLFSVHVGVKLPYPLTAALPFKGMLQLLGCSLFCKCASAFW